jgi:hypothetical protein
MTYKGYYSFSKPRDKMLNAAFASLSTSNPQAGHGCSRTHSGLSDSTPHEAHSLVVPAGSNVLTPWVCGAAIEQWMRDDDGVDESEALVRTPEISDFWGRCIPALLRYSPASLVALLLEGGGLAPMDR